jgi:hypothetical protein
MYALDQPILRPRAESSGRTLSSIAVEPSLTGSVSLAVSVEDVSERRSESNKGVREVAMDAGPSFASL